MAANIRNIKSGVGEFFEKKRGLAILAAGVLVFTLIFNSFDKVFPHISPMWPMVITLVILLAVAWGQKAYFAWRDKRPSKR